MVYVITYIIGMILTFVFTSIFLDDPGDRDTIYEFPCLPVAFFWPICLIIAIVIFLFTTPNKLSHKIYDEFHKRR